MSELLMPRDVAEQLNISVEGVYRMVREGQLRAIRLSSRRMRISREALDEFIRAGAAREAEPRKRAASAA